MPKSLKIFLLVLILLTYAFTIAQPINLTTADLGRHIKNGEFIFKDLAVLETNFYSYTYPDYPFINHHWLSGVIFYLIHQISGFVGLSLFFMTISLATFYIFFHLAWKYANFTTAVLLSALIIPLLSTRTEIRPESFSYFFLGVFFWLLYNYQNSRISFKWLWLMPVLEVLWVNLHIYFIFGIFLIGVFWLESLLKANRIRGIREVREIGVILGFSLGATLLNPAGLAGVLYPLHIFDARGYRVLEEQSVWFIENIMAYPPALYFKITLGIFLLSWIFGLKGFFVKKQIPLALLLISLVFTALGFLMVRNFAIFGLFVLSIAAINLKVWKIRGIGVIGEEYKSLVLPCALAFVFFAMVVINPNFWLGRNGVGLGIVPGNEKAVRFFLENKLSGPLFNNYDIGGYLIYYLFPKEKVFVDNRPEVYPARFFKDTYMPVQDQDSRWQEAMQKYHFNSIFFYRRDNTPWGQKFLISRVEDPNWAPVYVDEDKIIFLKRDEKNLGVIKQYELPKSLFQIKKP